MQNASVSMASAYEPAAVHLLGEDGVPANVSWETDRENGSLGKAQGG